MSIRDSLKARIRQLVREERLFRLHPAYGERRRCVLVSAEVLDLLSTDPQTPEEERVYQIRGNLEGFIVGETFKIARHPFDKDPSAEIAPVHPIHDGIWDFRVTDLEDGSRCFVAFVGKDAVVALAYEMREDISDFNKAQEEGRAAWDRLFGPLEPFKGDSLNDYLSQPFEAV